MAVPRPPKATGILGLTSTMTVRARSSMAAR